MMIGIDMTPAAAGTASTDGVATCKAVNKGDEFDADVFVTNIQSLTAWELRIDYDPQVVSLDSADYNFLLVSSGGSVFPSQFEVEKPGRKFLAAAEAHFPDSGSGILARLHLKAVADGVSPIRIATNPAYYGPTLVGASGDYEGDTNGDNHWDGDVSGGSVAVGRSCSAATPFYTPAPVSPGVTPNRGGVTPTPPGNGGSPDSGQSSPAASPAPGDEGDVLNVQPTDSASGGNSAESVASPASGQGNDPESGQQPGDGTSGGSTASAQGSDGGGATTIVLIAGGFAFLAIAAGAAVLFLRRSTAD
jgi:hypothetical protein